MNLFEYFILKTLNQAGFFLTTGVQNFKRNETVAFNNINFCR